MLLRICSGRSPQEGTPLETLQQGDFTGPLLALGWVPTVCLGPLWVLSLKGCSAGLVVAKQPGALCGILGVESLEQEQHFRRGGAYQGAWEGCQWRERPLEVQRRRGPTLPRQVPAKWVGLLRSRGRPCHQSVGLELELQRTVWGLRMFGEEVHEALLPQESGMQHLCRHLRSDPGQASSR